MKNVLKKKWGKPVTEVQQFTPQEFVALCAKCEIGLTLPSSGGINITGTGLGTIFLHGGTCSHEDLQNVSVTPGEVQYFGNKYTVYVWRKSGMEYHAATKVDNHS